MDKKWIASVAAILAAVMVLALMSGALTDSAGASGTASSKAESAGENAASGESRQDARVNFAAEEDIDDVHLRDKDSLYENQDDTAVTTMYLTVSTGNEDDGTNHTWTEVNQYSAYDYEEMGVDRYKVEGLLQVGDENGPVTGEFGADQVVPNATVQIRGQTSSRYSQKNYKIRIKKNKGTWHDQRTINLNKHQGDGMRFHNKLGFDMLRRIPQLLSLRTTFVHLYVRDLTAGGNGEFTDYGLYTQVEQLNKRALRAHGLDQNGQLYKINFFEFYRYPDVIKLRSDPDYDKDKFEQYLEIKGSEDHSKLIDMLEDLNDYTIPIEDIIDEHFDMENLTYWMAYNILTGNLDTQSRNTFLYSPLNGDTWYFLCWDLDAGMRYDEEQIRTNINDFQSWQQGVSNYWGNVLFRRCLTSEVFREKLQDAVDDIRTNDLTEDVVREMVESYRSIVKPYVYRMPDAQHAPLTEPQYDAVADKMPKLIDFYYQHYLETLKKPMPFYIGTPEINGNQMVINWDASYDFDNEKLTYTATVASDPLMKNVLYTYTGEDISAVMNRPAAGQYYLKVSVKNSSGYAQDAFDIAYLADDTRVFGEICFYVNADGSVTQDGTATE